MQPYPYLSAWLSRLCATSIILLYAPVPTKFWATVEAYMEVPTSIILFINPLGGSICAVIAEAINDWRLRVTYPDRIVPHEPWWLMPSKIFMGWAVGRVSVGMVSQWIKAEDTTIAFWAGASGTALFAVIVALIVKNAGNNNNSTKN